MFFDFFYQSPESQQNNVVKWETAKLLTYFQSSIFYVTCMNVLAQLYKNCSVRNTFEPRGNC